ncbi:MAG: TrmB family transcriptional regulator [Candidatus Nanoarchaeia archaeon]
MKEELKDFGLTENEAKVYLALVEIGDSTMTPIRNKSGIHTSRVYEALNSLIEKGLVSYFLKNNVKNFKAQDPAVMFNILGEKKEKLQRIIPEIELLRSKSSPQHSVSVYEGYKAAKQIFDNLLGKCGPKDEILVLGAQPESVHFMGTTFFRQYTARRIKKKVKMRIIFNWDAEKTAKEYKKFAYTEARLLPKDVLAPTAINIHPDEITILLLKEKPIVFDIASKDIAASYKSYFEYLWKHSKKV